MARLPLGMLSHIESMQENKSILRLLQLKYGSTDEWELWEQAWNKYPSLKKDCPTTQKFKELAREDYVKKLKKLQHGTRYN